MDFGARHRGQKAGGGGAGMLEDLSRAGECLKQCTTTASLHSTGIINCCLYITADAPSKFHDLGSALQPIGAWRSPSGSPFILGNGQLNRSD